MSDIYCRDTGFAWLVTLGAFLVNVMTGFVKSSISELEDALQTRYQGNEKTADRLLTLHLVTTGLAGR